MNGTELLALSKAEVIQQKFELTKTLVRRCSEKGKDPSAAVKKLRSVKEALDSRNPDKALAVLDEILSELQKIEKSGPSSASALPAVDRLAPEADLFEHPQIVEIVGYAGNCMEPFLSHDGAYLFFNNSNAKDADTHIHFAKRLQDDSFKYRGRLPGTTSDGKDMGPAGDSSGRFVFTSTREYFVTRDTLFIGQLVEERVVGTRAIPGNISDSRPGWLNMDCDLSDDGKLIFSRARFDGGEAPRESNLMLAVKKNDKYEISPDSGKIFENINTQALEYAPALSRDGRTLYFTRAARLVTNGKEVGPSVKLMVAYRTSNTKPFQPPRAIRGIDGLVEGPCLSPDEKVLYFHKKVGETYRIFTARKKR